LSGRSEAEGPRPAPRSGTGSGDLGHEPDDRSLLLAHVEGDPDAFGILFRRHRDRLWAVALRTLGDPEEAADALQDAMVSAFRRAGSYRGDAAVTTWLHRVVVNACLDRLRRRKVRAADSLPDDLDEYAGRGSLATSTTGNPASRDAADPAEVVVDGERRTLVLRALDTLAADQKAALVLVDMQGYSVEEAAAVLGCPPGTVKSRCSRGRAKLAPLLAPLRASPQAGPGPTPDGNPRSAVDVQPKDPREEVSGHGPPA
jgi:RNA polymerase sigma-70 factor, ECF subfamily